jgi:hypothetical protein
LLLAHFTALNGHLSDKERVFGQNDLNLHGDVDNAKIFDTDDFGSGGLHAGRE